MVILFGAVFLVSFCISAFASDVEMLKHGVVKITAKNPNRIGTGVIVGVKDNTAYIATASHVIEGDPSPQVTFYQDSSHTYPAKIQGMEGGNPKGLAALVVEGELPAGIRPLAFYLEGKVTGGEKVTVIGFPRLAPVPWAVTEGTITGLVGPDLIFTGPLEEGNSGGPLLYRGKVVGLITEVAGSFNYAKPAVMAQYELKNWHLLFSDAGDSPLPRGIPFNSPTQPLALKEMVLVPGGTFWMGSPEDESRSSDERPRHNVLLDPFYLDIFEVTTGQYAQFMSATGHAAPEFWDQVDLSRDKKKPVVGVSWQDANDFCDRAGKRLPTEAEWEKAARGTDERKYPWGQKPPSTDMANFDQKPTPEKVYSDRLKPVGSYEKGKSQLGVYDMAGNAWEWVADWYDKKYYGISPKKNPKGPETGEEKVMRGGSWDDLPTALRSGDRSKLLPSEQNDSVGFRCAKDAP
jgi:formylglycine-generating enzyme required for sulfatase activity